MEPSTTALYIVHMHELDNLTSEHLPPGEAVERLDQVVRTALSRGVPVCFRDREGYDSDFSSRFEHTGVTIHREYHHEWESSPVKKSDLPEDTSHLVVAGFHKYACVFATAQHAVYHMGLHVVTSPDLLFVPTQREDASVTGFDQMKQQWYERQTICTKDYRDLIDGPYLR